MGGGAGGNVAARGIQYGEIAFLAASQVRRSQARGKVSLARVGDTAGRQRIKSQRGTRYWCKVAVDVEDHVGRGGDINADGPARTIAASALMRPSIEFRVETSGWFSPVGQMVK